MALQFNNATSDRVACGTMGSWDALVGTFVAWTYWNNNNNNFKAIFSKWTGGLVGVQLGKKGSDGTTARFIRVRATTNGDVTTPTGTFSTGWQCIAATWDTSTGTPAIYRGTLTADMADVSSGATNGSGTPTDITAETTYIGNTRANTDSWDGKIGPVAIFNTRLTLAELIEWQWTQQASTVPRLYLQLGWSGTTTAIDWSGNKYDGTITGATLYDHPPIRPFFGLDREWQGNSTAAASGAMAGTCAIAFGNSTTLTGSGALAGSCAVAFGDSTTLAGSGSLSGTATVAFADSCTLAGSGSLAGSSALIFADSTTLAGSGALAGSCAVLFSDSSTLLGAGVLAGLSTLTFSDSSTLGGGNVLTGSIAITFGDASTLTGSGTLAGTASLVFSDSSTLNNLRTGRVLQTFYGQATHSWGEALCLAKYTVDSVEYLLVGGTCDFSGNYTGGVDTFTGATFRWVLSRYTLDGTLDTTFGTYGQVHYSFGREDDELSSIVIDPVTNDITVAGISYGLTGPTMLFKMLRFTEDGQLKPQFGSFGKASYFQGSFRYQNAHVDLQTSGKIISSSDWAISVGLSRIRIGRFHENGAVDTSFGDTSGSTGYLGYVDIQMGGRDTQGPTNYGHVLILSDDTIIHGGKHDSSGAPRHDQGFLFKLLVDGHGSDTTFGMDLGANYSGSHTGNIYGLLVDGANGQAQLNGFALTATDGVLACGNSKQAASSARQAIMALCDSAGSLVTSFDGNGILETLQGSLGNNVMFQPVITSGGNFRFFGYDGDNVTTVDDITHYLAIGTDATGALDSTWGTSGVVDISNNMALWFNKVDHDGDTLFLSGHQAWPAASGIAQASICRLTSAGAFDTTFGDPAVSPTLPTAPDVVTGSASAITDTTASIAGTVDPNSTTTTFHTEYGLTTSYGLRTAEQTVGSQATPQNVSDSLTGLIPNKTYYYRLVANNGTVTLGSQGSFTTLMGKWTILTDTFTDTDSLDISNRMADTDYTGIGAGNGTAYLQVTGRGSIQTNKARWDSSSLSAGNKKWYNLRNSGATDVTVTGKITWNGASDGGNLITGVIARAASQPDNGSGTTQNWIAAGFKTGSNVFIIMKDVSASQTTVATTAFTPVSGTEYTITLSCNNTLITAILNPGGLSLSGTVTEHTTNTYCGWFFNKGIGDTIDDFNIDNVYARISSSSTALTFSDSSTLSGSGALSGTCSLAFSNSGTLSSEAMVGTASITFSDSATLTGSGTLTGTSSLTFTDTTTLTGSGELAGTCAVVFTNSGTLTGTGANDLTGVIVLTFADSSTLTGSGSLTGTGTLTFSDSTTLQGSGVVQGSAALSFGDSVTLSGSGALAGSSALTFSVSTSLIGSGALAGSCAVVFSDTATLSTNDLVGSCALLITPTGTLTASGTLTGTSALTFALTGNLIDAASIIAGPYYIDARAVLRAGPVSVGVFIPGMVEVQTERV